MTYRERREARAERLRGWADKRETQASAVLQSHERYRGDVAFYTQPGHIPERARVIRQSDRAFESLQKADSMNSRADSIEGALATSIYNDDPDAIEALEARIAKLEAKRAEMNAANAAYRKEHKAELAALTAYERSHAVPYPSYALANLSGNLSSQRKRLTQLKAKATS